MESGFIHAIWNITFLIILTDINSLTRFSEWFIKYSCKWGLLTTK